jgi:exodeoxyribonuclease-3
MSGLGSPTLFDEVGYVDAFRVVNQEAEQYTWWSNRGQAYVNNVGWRIDYHIVSPDLKDKIAGTSIYKDEKFSDHAPLILDYNIR